MSKIGTKVQLYLTANGKDYETEHTAGNVIVMDNGDGAFIHTWNVDGLTKPTDSQLDALDSDATKSENNAGIRATRKTSYGDIGEQLDEIYKDIDAWKARIKKIKDDNPKE
tara:strand:- start:1057 stop:1389 length:333 start_codon:yes stop_codon:yes gene_type:complete